ncbi:MAG: sugar kinase [Deltaproteobacteria bacterium]|nr:sugar kinase [Deltaproteobacteria bacterium]
MSLLVVGSVAYDSVQTPHDHRKDALGGSATFFSIAAALFHKPSLVAVVGEDFAERDVHALEHAGVDLSGLERAEGRTFRWGGRYSVDMNHRDTLFTELNVFESFKPQLNDAHRDASLVFLANIQPGLQLSVLEQVGCPRFVAADTMNLWIAGARDELLEVLSRVDAIFLNDSEALELTGCRTMVAAAGELRAMGPPLVIIKRGEHGALVFNEDDIFYVPAYPLEAVIDPTGAGDTFAGGFMGYLAETRSFTPENIRRAAVVGSLMASFCVEGFSIEGLRRLTLDDVRRRYSAFLALTRIDALAL